MLVHVMLTGGRGLWMTACFILLIVLTFYSYLLTRFTVQQYEYRVALYCIRHLQVSVVWSV